MLINRNMKNALMSQFLRQHHSSVKTELWNLIPAYAEKYMDQNDEVNVTCYADKAAYVKLMSLRSHWFADWSEDMWGGIVGDFIQQMNPREFWEFLPNGNGKQDPYFRDMMSRVTREEHNLPCPIMCEWPDLIEARAEMYSASNPIIKAYRGLVAKGFIKDNLNNKYRRMYIDGGKP
jgi:hypothetical protein